MPARHVLSPLILFAVLCCTALAGPGKDSPFAGKRVMLLGIDGCRPDALRKLVESGKAPNLRSLIENGTVCWNAYAGGLTDTDSEQDTSSGPGWTTILTGVWKDRHGVRDNKFRYHRIAQWPHWMRRIKEHAPQASLGSLCDWPEIHDYIVKASRRGGTESFLDLEFLTTTKDAAGKRIDYVACDAEITQRAIEHLKTGNPDVLFVYFGNVDETGHGAAHKDGRFAPDNEPYLAALARVDAHVGELLSAMKARPQFAEEDWLVLATTDHGGIDTKHGGQTPEERTIWMLASGGAAPKGKLAGEKIPQTIVAPTVFHHLNIPIDPAWGWDAAPFALPSR